MKILYHANCNDGSGAALAAYMALGEATDTGDPIEYIPVQYGSEPPAVDDEDVYILDFSYPRNVILQMAAVAKSIVIIDHHKTAAADLKDPFPQTWDSVPLCDVNCIFDMTKSGAVLSWEYFHGRRIAPELFLYIQDRDLWEWKMEGTADILKCLSLTEDWKDWRRFIHNPEDLKKLYTGGAAINRYLYLQAEKIIQSPPTLWEIEGDTVPVYNLPGFMISDTLHMALEKYPEAPYAVAYFDLPDKRVYSLRSRKGSDVDVSEIARRNGGGGHKEAAGFPVPISG